MILGAQFYTLRDFCTDLQGLDESMKKVADIGFKSIQLSGVCDYEGEWVAEKIKEYGLTVDITHTPAAKIVEDTENVIKLHDAMNCKCIGLGYSELVRTPESIEEFYNTMKPAIKKISESGHKFMYHNHHYEFAKCGDKTALELLCEKFTPDECGITLDTFWVQTAGGDPAAWIRKLKGRLDRVHFKDMVFSLEDKKSIIAPIGEGNMNYDAIIEACLASDVEIGYVELDDCHGDDPFDCMKRSYHYLTSRYGLK